MHKLKELMIKRNNWLQVLKHSLSAKLILFVIVAVILFFVGIMTGFIINHDNVIKMFDLSFWHHIFETIGGED
ncbi:hypothetical protein [Staphylococcus coagulans]|uniref:hypothetical protein n=2 Tax=Staphylococcus coagulans TaxID=74706 RepID=UPI001F4C2F67|nr:hypothetical protein [Staphylococcus coagulans]MDR9833533.1 hypothetical protein [Staphylococcus coagulans]UNB49290.1 hypothetical protein KM149_03895 [Staphylococcus coagulans]